MKKFFVLIAAVLAVAIGAGEVQLFGPEVLKDADNFVIHRLKFTPAAEGKAAEIVFPGQQWSAIYRMYRIPAAPAGTEFVFSVSGRMVGEKFPHSASLYAYFYDAKGKEIKTKVKESWFKKHTNEQTVQISAPVPENAVMIRPQICTHGGFKIVLSDMKLSFRGENVSAEKLFGLKIVGQDSFSTNYWRPHKMPYSPTKEPTAKITFPNGRWTALLSHKDIDPAFRGKLIVKGSYRNVGDFKAMKHTALSLEFKDKARQALPIAVKGSNSRKLSGTATWKEIYLEVDIPEGAVRFDMQFSSHGGATIEVKDFEISLKGTDLSEAAIRGISMSGLVPAGRKAAPATADWAEVECFKSVPFDFAAPFWKERPEYRIPNTRMNKSPLQKGDNKASFRMAADKEYIYIFFRALDEKLNFDSEVLCKKDCFEFFFMPVGKYKNARSRIGLEQYTITRDKTGKTVFGNSCTGKTRLFEGGWEAIMRVPLQNEVRKIYPFCGLELTFNASYQDADSVGQEHWLSFSPKDVNSMSYNQPALYLPLTFVSQLPLPYKPLWLGDSAEYNVTPKFAGRINLIEMKEDIRNLGPWDNSYNVKVTGDGEVFRAEYPNVATGRLRFQLPVFIVYPGETIEYGYEARISKGSVKAPAGSFLAHTNWMQFPFRRTSAASRVGTEWTKISYAGKVPEIFRENIRSGRLLTEWGDHPGRVLEIRDFWIKRRLPVDFDARIFFDTPYAHIRPGEPGKVFIEMDSPITRKVKVQLEAKDFFSKKTLLKETRSLDIPAGRSKIEWKVGKLPAGFFNLYAKIRSDKGGYLADREHYVAKYIPPKRTNISSGIWIPVMPDQTPPLDYANIARTYKDLGLGFTYVGDMDFLDAHDKPVPVDPVQTYVKPFKEAGFEVGTIITRGNRLKKSALLAQPAGLDAHFKACLSTGNGLIDYWNFCNETNLDGGWLPTADGREWIVFYRALYNAVRKYSPNAKLMIGNLNRIPKDYMHQFYSQNRNGFAEGIIGVHLYGAEYNRMQFENLMDFRNEYEKYYPGWKVWDMESGSVHHSFAMLSEMLSKKMPIHLSCGVERSVFYTTNDFLIPGGDATPLVAVEAQKNAFYYKAKPVGRITIGKENEIHVYLFKLADGKGGAVLWNTTLATAKATLPASAGAEQFDMFGNSLGRSKDNAKLQLKDRFVRYFCGVDTDKLAQHSTFKPAFKAKAKSPRMMPEKFSREVFVVPENVTRNFDFRFAPGREVKISMVYCNESGKTVTVKPAVKCDKIFKTAFDKKEFQLAPGAKEKVTLSMSAAGNFSKGTFEVGGSLSNGKELLSVVYTCEPAPPISVEADTRSITVRNNSNETTDIELVPSCMYVFFRPDMIRFKNVKPGETRTAALTVLINDTNQHRLLRPNRPEIYDLRVIWKGGEFKSRGLMVPFLPKPLNGKVDFSKLPESIVSNGLRVDYQLIDAKNALRVAARIYDDTPVQKHEHGDIRNGGDVFVIAFSDGGKIYREYGFSIADGRRHAYLWRGRLGLETASDAPKVINTLNRTGKYIDLDVSLPLEGVKPGCALSLKIIDRDKSGKDRVIDLGGGIVPRDLNKMGTWITK